MKLMTFSLHALQHDRHGSEIRMCAQSESEHAITVDVESDSFRNIYAAHSQLQRERRAARAARAVAAQTPTGKSPCMDEAWRELGPRLWGELHRRAAQATAIDAPAERAWLDRFAARITCDGCVAEWRRMMDQTPPDFSSRDAYFAWGVARHNEVNARLGKPSFPLGDARRLYRVDA